MSKKKPHISPAALKALYEQGENITAFLRAERGVDHNTPEIIEIAYDLQTGSYIDSMQDEGISQQKAAYSREIAATILGLCSPETLLEAGVGEATTLSGVLQNMPGEIRAYGFDLSWSRVACGQRWLQAQGIGNSQLCTGDLLHMPFQDNAIDVVYTSHSIEPNGGHEEAILQELYRVAGKYLVLLEPAYELADEAAKQRMTAHGYCRNLPGISESLGYDVRDHRLFPHIANPMNPTALTIIRKDETRDAVPSGIFACPQFKTPLKEIDGVFFSPEALMVYPVIDGIPCLRVDNGIFASKFDEFAK